MDSSCFTTLRFAVGVAVLSVCLSVCLSVRLCVCVYVLKTIADVCSYVDWREISGEFKCLYQGHYLTL